MIKSLTPILLLLCYNIGFSQTKAYEIYTHKGKKITFEKMLKNLENQDIVLFGEYHNNPISHWLELEITKELHEKRSKIGLFLHL